MSFDFEKARSAFNTSIEKNEEHIEDQRDLLLDYQLESAIELASSGILERAGEEFLVLYDMENYLPVVWYSRSISGYNVSIETYGLTYRRINLGEEMPIKPVIVAERFLEGGELEMFGGFTEADGEIVVASVEMLIAAKTAGVLSLLGPHCDQIPERSWEKKY